MNTNNSTGSNGDMSGYLNISIFDPPEHSTFYDKKADTQGVVPGRSLEEAEAAFERHYGISLL